MNNLIKILALLLMGCSSLPYKKAILVPKTSYRVNQNIIRTNGYYYAEKTKDDFCRMIPYAYGMTGDKNSKYLQKYISAFVLYSDGYAYHTGSLHVSGIDKSSFDFCNELDQNNTFDRAQEKFESYISHSYYRRNESKFDRGVFELSKDTLRIQIYQSGAPTLLLMEYEGTILSDTAFHLHNRKLHGESKKFQNEKLNEIYRYKEYKTKPDSTSYIRDHRSKFPLSKRN